MRLALAHHLERRLTLAFNIFAFALRRRSVRVTAVQRVRLTGLASTVDWQAKHSLQVDTHLAPILHLDFLFLSSRQLSSKSMPLLIVRLVKYVQQVCHLG